MFALTDCLNLSETWWAGVKPCTNDMDDDYVTAAAADDDDVWWIWRYFP